MSPTTIQLILTVVAGLLIASMVALARWVAGKADKSEVAKADVEINKTVSKLEVKLDAALLVVAASITRPELSEKLLALTGRIDDRMERAIADIVQLNIDAKANAKAASETEKRLDDLPARVRTLEEGQRRS